MLHDIAEYLCRRELTLLMSLTMQMKMQMRRFYRKKRNKKDLTARGSKDSSHFHQTPGLSG